MYKFLLLVAALIVFSLPLMAQEDKVDIFGGYEYLNLGNNNTNGIALASQGFNGWNVAVTGKLNRIFGVEGDFAGTYASVDGVNVHVYTYTGGPVVAMPFGRIRPFAHLLFGGMQLAGSQSGASVSWNGFTTMFGGGVDAKVNRLFSIRVAQVDWLYYHFGSKTADSVSFPSFSGSDNVRFSTGVVLRF
jgi:hypothetical protein